MSGAVSALLVIRFNLLASNNLADQNCNYNKYKG